MLGDLDLISLEGEDGLGALMDRMVISEVMLSDDPGLLSNAGEMLLFSSTFRRSKLEIDLGKVETGLSPFSNLLLVPKNFSPRPTPGGKVLEEPVI